MNITDSTPIPNICCTCLNVGEPDAVVGCIKCGFDDMWPAHQRVIDMLKDQYQKVINVGIVAAKSLPNIEGAQLLDALKLMVAAYPYRPPCFDWDAQVEAHKAASAAIAAAGAGQ